MEPTWYEVTVKCDEVEVWYSDEIHETNINMRWSTRGCRMSGVVVVMDLNVRHPEGKNYQHQLAFSMPGSTPDQREAVVAMLLDEWQQYVQEILDEPVTLPKQPVTYVGSGPMIQTMPMVSTPGPERIMPQHSDGRFFCMPVKQISQDEADIFVEFKSAQIAVEVLCVWDVPENPTAKRVEMEETARELMRHLPVGIIEIAHNQIAGK